MSTPAGFTLVGYSPVDGSGVDTDLYWIGEGQDGYEPNVALAYAFFDARTMRRKGDKGAHVRAVYHGPPIDEQEAIDLGEIDA